MASPSVVRVPKEYYQKRRFEGHQKWQSAFWRELFQNSVDAGADRVDITVEEVSGKGSFGRAPEQPRVIRVTFSDNGKGMESSVINDVFFQPGKSTKGSSDTGGFGTARLMLCFSQARYGIRTLGSVVEGDGSEYVVETVDEAVASRREWISDADTRGDAAAAEALRAEMAALQAEPAVHRGCRFEIDIDPNEREYSYYNPSKESLLGALDEWLSMSQVPCKVFLNGAEKTERTLKGPARRSMVAEIDGVEKTFGTIHVSQGDKAKFKGRILVRLNGSTMYFTETSSSHQVVVELEPAMGKECLTDNRDSLKWEYRRAMDGFVEQLVVDKKSALEDSRNRKHIELKGGKGRIFERVARVDVDLRAAAFLDGPVELSITDSVSNDLPRPRYLDRDHFEQHGFGGIPAEFVEKLIEAARNGETTFLDDFPDLALVDDARAAFRSDGLAALNTLPNDVLQFLMKNLRERVEHAKSEQMKADMGAMLEMHDVHVVIENPKDDPHYKNAIRRFDPKFWRPQGAEGKHVKGRGMNAHMLLAAWTIACKYAVRAVLQARPGFSNGEVEFATGWLFKPSNDDGRTHAVHKKHGEKIHLFLLNPVDDEGHTAWDIGTARRNGAARKSDGSNQELAVADLIAVATHEACHMLRDSHNEEFASVLTSAIALFDIVSANAEMKIMSDAISAMYGSGKTLVQALETEDAIVPAVTDDTVGRKKSRSKADSKPRPAEVLLAHALPGIMATAGIAEAPDNSGIGMPGLQAVPVIAAEQVEPGVVEVDCDILAMADKVVRAAVAAGCDPEAPVVEEILSADALDLDMAELPVLSALAAGLVREEAGLEVSTKAPEAPAPVYHFGAMDRMAEVIQTQLPAEEPVRPAPPVAARDPFAALDANADLIARVLPQADAFDAALAVARQAQHVSRPPDADTLQSSDQRPIAHVDRAVSALIGDDIVLDREFFTI